MPETRTQNPPMEERHEQLSFQFMHDPRYRVHNERLWGDNCPRCHAVHLNVKEATVCRQANAQREQY